MGKTWLVFLLVGVLLPPPAPPELVLTNDTVQTTLYLPDAQQGYYRGTRFDWAGAFKSLTYKGHTYVSQWFSTYEPTLHDAINGPAEEFVALGFADARPGDTFLKIGVGMLRKPDDKPYAFARYYDVVNGGNWSVKNQKDRVVFRHELTDSTGYGYRYEKTVRLSPDKPELLLEHRLTNTGRKPIETSVYDHNFWIIDGEPTGPNVAISFPYPVQAEGKGFGDLIRADANQLLYSRVLNKGETVFTTGVQGVGQTARDYDIRIDNRRTGAGLRITADQPIEKLVYWACATTSCPEPYVRVNAAPGQTAAWTIHYAFY